MSEGHFFSFSLFYCHPLFFSNSSGGVCLSLFVPSSSCVFLKSLIWNTPTSPQFWGCIPLIAFIRTNPSWNPELSFKVPEYIIVIHTLRILHCVAMVSLFTLRHMQQNIPPLVSLKQFCPSRRGKCGLNAQEDLRKSFIFLIKTDSDPEGFKLLFKSKALSSRSEMDDSETSELLYRNICLYPCEKKHMFSFVPSVFQKKPFSQSGDKLDAIQ